MSTGTEFAKMVRKAKRMNTRTRNYRDSKFTGLKDDILEDIAMNNNYPGAFSEERTRLYNAAYIAMLAWDKHVRGYRIDPILNAQLQKLTPWEFAGFLGEMIDAGIANVGQAEYYFQEMARQMRVAA